MIAEYLRSQARWRLDRADERDGGRNARSAIGLLDAVTYACQLDDGDRAIVRMSAAGCFAQGRYNPGVEGERIIRFWHFDDVGGGPAELFEALASAAERGLVPLPRAQV